MADRYTPRHLAADLERLPGISFHTAYTTAREIAPAYIGDLLSSDEPLNAHAIAHITFATAARSVGGDDAAVAAVERNGVMPFANALAEPHELDDCAFQIDAEGNVRFLYVAARDDKGVTLAFDDFGGAPVGRVLTIEGATFRNVLRCFD